MKVVSVDAGLEDERPDTEIMDFVDQMGGYFESSGLPRLAGRLLGWLLVCDPERQSSEELAAALGASSGGISINARMLSQFGFIERLGVAGDRRTYFRLRPHAFAAGERQRIRIMADLTAMADAGLAAGARTQAAGNAQPIGLHGNGPDQRPGPVPRSDDRGQAMKASAIWTYWLTRCFGAAADTRLLST